MLTQSYELPETRLNDSPPQEGHVSSVACQASPFFSAVTNSPQLRHIISSMFLAAIDTEVEKMRVGKSLV